VRFIHGNEYAYTSGASITEQVIDYDLIREQILVAAGVAISGLFFTPLHAIECRINVRKILIMISVLPGKITTLHMPGGHGVRLDTHVFRVYYSTIMIQ
jgi:acetyl-CoA carboxylase biotin carboxylase subunit